MFLLRLLGYFNTKEIRKSIVLMKFLEDCLMITEEGDRTDKILNQLQTKKNYNGTLRNNDMRNDPERDDQKGKSLKLSF